MKRNFLNIIFENNLESDKFSSFGEIYQVNRQSRVKAYLIGILIFACLVLFLPWTQNIRAKGKVTTLRLEDRPQELNTIIPGRVVKWYVKEGDFVKKGDTILQLGEVKVEYFDPTLLKRTQQQISAKNRSIAAYEGKANTADTQILALENALKFKLQSVDNKIEQQKMKITSDSADLAAAQNAVNAYKRQIQAAKVMLDSGAISLIEFEKRSVNYQDGVAKVTSVANKLNQSKQELLNLKIEKNGVRQEYNDKFAKALGDRLASESSIASGEAEVFKLENTLSNYDARQQLYFIVAPQSGQITQAKKAGIGEMLKEGDMVVEVVPTTQNRAVEMFVYPMAFTFDKQKSESTFCI